MTTASAEVQYESRVRMRYAVLAFLAALLLVASQLLQLSGVHAPVSELTLDLITANQRSTQNIIGAAVDTLGLLAVGATLMWLHRRASARRPELQKVVRWLALVGAVLSAVMAITYTIIVAHRAHEFVTTGNQSYPEADHLTTGGVLFILPVLLELGTLMLTIGCIWTCLSVMRVGLYPRIVGYIGVIAGALFLFPIGALVPVIQGVWLAATAVLLAKRWPQGDPPAWVTGEAVAWQPSEAQQRAIEDRRAKREQRGQRGRRTRISDADVLAAIKDPAEPQSDSTASPSASSTKRKRKRRA